MLFEVVSAALEEDFWMTGAVVDVTTDGQQ
jgi:hypothetical protein